MEFKFEVAQDRTAVTIDLPEQKFRLSAADLETFMRALAIARANMTPPVPDENLKEDSKWSTVPCNRWSTVPDPEAPTHIRLYLQHMGFGWVWISLSQQQAIEMQAGLKQALSDRPTIS